MVADVTGGDLYHLWRVSEVHLPRVADVFYDANRLIGGPGRNSGDSFRGNTPAYPGASVMTSSVGAAWEGVRAGIQAMTEQLGSTVLDAAQGVREARQAYLDVDTANAAKFDAYLKNPANHDPSDANSNPPVAGSADDPGKPVPE